MTSFDTPRDGNGDAHAWQVLDEAGAGSTSCFTVLVGAALLALAGA